ncbi:SfnB family sulfur acquisition oxidoreductase [Aureimonas leprariae]|uniref:SfnB family sulfur acquisition oxidoreductase n=1 Tax=Plantimonas leprariae TaxID=2615207 RepID=A0A7V7TW17_9HYPH|nr:SfnB family sulfur acquisition oxidoreductase [Aureimonas leprariae]KAB0679102.1 SfnB family sulfur acquisition oxidoreductase [Aureimonas leprariae]
MTDASAPGAGAPRRPLPPARPHLVRSDAEAIGIAERLAEEVAGGASERDRERRLPWDEIERFTASGLGAITVPRALGGADVSYRTLAEVFAILCAADPSLGQIPQNHFGVLQLVRELGSEAQKRRFFGAVLAGARIGNAGPERGGRKITDTRTRLRRTPEGLRLDGHRFYSTGAIFAHWIPTRALDDEDKPVQIWVPADGPGVSVVDDWRSFGQRTTASGSVVFESVAVEPDDVVPIHAFAKVANLMGPVSQMIQAAIDLGIARAAFADAVAFVRDRARPWMDSGVERAVDDPTILHGVGQLATNLHAAEALLWEAAERLDAIAAAPVTDASSGEASVAVAEAKILTTEIALEASETLFDLAGSSATRAAHGLDRHWRNARVHTLHDPVRWKFHLLGNQRLNGVLPARHQWN